MGIREKVRDAHSAAAIRPKGRHPFPVGREFAESIGYAPDLLLRMPAACVDAFAGVSNVSVLAGIPAGSRVLDLGCGAGLDSLIAAHRTGPRGAVIGIDFSEDMLQRARCGASESGASNVVFCRADGERLPIATDSIDVAIVNGIFNLNPTRGAIFGELARVLRPGGAVYAAELILSQPRPPEQESDEANWFA